MKKNQPPIFTSTNNILSTAVEKAIAKAQTGIGTSTITPPKTSTTGVKPYTSVVSPATSADNRAGQTAQKAYSTGQGTKDAVLLNERQIYEAQLVRQLPKDFPIQNWENMPTKAQVFAIQHSGLSKEDQWTLLNATAPFHVLATASPVATSGVSNTRSSVRQPTPFKTPAFVSPIATSGSRNTGSSEGQPPISGLDAETQRAVQSASRQAANAYNQLNQTLTDSGMNTGSLSGTGNDIYKSTRIAMANVVLQGTLDLSKQSKMIQDASAGIAPGKTAPATVQAWQGRVSQADTASKEMIDMLESVHVDTDNLSKEQQVMIAKAERQLRDGIISGTLDEDGTNEMIRRICNKVTSETTPPKGVTYVTLVDPKLDLRGEETKRNQIMIRRGTALNQADQLLGDALKGINVDTNKLSDQQKRIVLAEQQNLADGILNGSLKGDAISAFVDNVCYRIATETTPPPGVTYARILDPSYQPKIQSAEEINRIKSWLDDDEIDATKFTNEQKISYANAQQKIRNGATKGLLTDEYVDHVYSTLINELSSKELTYEYTDARGRKANGTTTTKDLIDPENNTLGARHARYALELVNQNLDYNARIILNPRAGSTDRRRWISIDCSGLVKYAAYQINPNWMKDAIGNKAENQMKRTGNNVVWQKTANQNLPNINALEAGDLLYWADENNKIVHTAIYIGDGLMVESAGSVRITDLRFTTIDNDGSEHELVQVNRLDETEEASYEEKE